MDKNSIHPLDEHEAHLIDRLRALAGATKPRPEFSGRLEADLLAKWNLTSAQGAPRGIIHLTQLWRQPMFKRLSLALSGAAAAALLVIFALSLFFGDGHGSLAPLPLMAAQSDLADYLQASTSLGAYGDIELVLATDLPTGPSEAPVYRQTISEPLATPEEALTWAKRFNLPNPKVYRVINASNPEAMTVVAEDGQALSFGDKNTGIYYNRGVDPPAGRQAGDSDTQTALGFDAARDVAIDFLESLDLVPDAYQVEAPSRTSWPGMAAHPIRSLIIRPQLDGYPAEGTDSRIYVKVGPDGTVQYLSMTPLAFTRGESYPLRSAQTAFESLLAGDTKGGAFLVRVESSASPEAEAGAAHTTYYRPDLAAYQAGDPLTVHGNVTLMRAEATGEVWARLCENYSGITFELTGPAIGEMAAELEFGISEVIVQGILQADTGARHRRLAVSEWSIAPPQVDRNPFEQNPFVGTVKVEGDITSLVADDGSRYRLLYPPDGLSDGDPVAVLAEAPVEGGELPGLRWLAIESPPATQEYVRSSSSLGGSAMGGALREIGEVGEAQVEKEMAEEAEVPAPADGVILGELSVENGVPVLVPVSAASEDQQIRVVGLPDEWSAGSDGRVISILGQVTPPAEAGDPPTIVWKAEGPVSPYRIGDEIELEGMVSADIHVDGDERWVDAFLQVGGGPDYAPYYNLSGPTDLMEELARHDRLHLRLQARVIPDENSGFGQLEVISYEKIWPEEKVQGFLGTHSMETLEGREVCTFTDNETGQRYAILDSLSGRTRPDFYKNFVIEGEKGFKQTFVYGIVRCDQTFAGLPVLEESGSQGGSHVNRATSADQLPLEIPRVIDESRFKTRRLLEKGRAIIDRVELVYYNPTGAKSKSHFTGENSEFFLFQPVWVFHGHTEDGRTTFNAYVQAVAEEYLQ